MNRDQFQATAIAILRSAVGWQSAIARRLGVEPRTVRRWIASDDFPPDIEARLGTLIGDGDISPWPRDEWLVGDALGGDGQRREYVMHLQPPRFVARVVAIDEDGDPEADELPADIVSGVVYQADQETVLCEIDWIDDVPPGERVKWLDAAADAIERDGLAAERGL
jgi:hypothetical protein